MKDVIDVMELQREKGQRIPQIDYRQLEFADGFTAARFTFECGMKLQAQPLTIATAAVLLHRFFKEVDSSNYDCFLNSLHPGLWVFLKAIKREQILNELRIEQYLSGQEPPPRKKKYRDSAARLIRVLSTWNEQIDISDYTRAVANNLSY